MTCSRDRTTAHTDTHREGGRYIHAQYLLHKRLRLAYLKLIIGMTGVHLLSHLGGVRFVGASAAHPTAAGTAVR